MTRRLTAIAALLSGIACPALSDAQSMPVDPTGLELVSELRIPSGHAVDGVAFGGISGLDRLGAEGRYVALSDDRSEEGPARIYELDVSVGEDGALDVEVAKTIPILTADGETYAEETVDPEAIRYHPATDSFFWVSEIDADGQAMLRQMGRDGSDMRRIALPDRLLATGEGRGHVESASLESLALTPDGATLYTATENALQQDGPRASAVAASPVRLLEIDAASGETTAEYLYVTDPIGTVSQDADRPWSDNGLAELFGLGDGRLVAIERNGWHVGDFAFHFAIRAYLVELEGATDISGIDALAGAELDRVQPARKTLLVDFGQLDLESVDNIEAVALGPVIDGEQSLLFASDDNFDGRQVTQFVLLK